MTNCLRMTRRIQMMEDLDYSKLQTCALVFRYNRFTPDDAT